MNFKISDEKKILFLRQLSLIYDSDMFSTDGIVLLQKTEKDESLKAFYDELLNQMNMGSSLSQAIGTTCDFFKEYELKLIELGEHSGNISAVLNDMANSIEREKIFNDKLKSSFRYPMILSLLTITVLLIIISVIVPIYHDLVLSGGVKIGVFMAMLNSFGLFLREKAEWIISGLIFLIIAFKGFKQTRWGMDFCKKYSLKTLFTRKIKLQASSIFFVKNLAMLLDSGIDFLTAFDILEQAESNEKVKFEIGRAKEVLKNTDSFREAMETFTLFPDVLHEMLNIAVSTGHIVPSLRKIEHTMNIELNKNIDKLISMIEPIITIIISVLVGIVLISGVLPIFKILSGLV